MLCLTDVILKVVVVVRFFIKFLTARESNDRQTVDESNSIKFKTSFVSEYTTYLTLRERVNTFVVILPNENKIKFMITARSIYSSGRHFQVLCEIFSLPQISKTVQLSTGKIQLNAMH